jgi:hypothetical protein
MNPADENAVADYLRGGGHVLRVRETIPATDQEIIEYLAACGIHAKYSEGDWRPYLCHGKRRSAGALVRLANRYRHEQHLAPFALRIDPTPVRPAKTSASGD